MSASLDSLFSARYQCPAGEKAPGAAVLIALGDSVVYERYFGFADIPAGRPVDENTLFNIASISKQFTVAALLRQDVDINSPCSDFFPGYPQPFWKDITLKHLASQSSGLPDSRDRSDRNACVFADEEQSVQYFPAVDSLKFAPGSAYDYLNPSFILLAKVVEKLSGRDFYEYQQSEIFGPLGMSSTVYFSPDSMPAQAAHAYLPGADGGWREYDYGEETFFATRPDGGIYSTARDMFKWEMGLAHGKVLSDSLLRLAYSPLTNVSDSPWCDYQRRPHTHYGLGWFVDSTPGRPVKVYHTGDNGGFQAYVAKYPETGAKIIVLENRNDHDRWSMATAIDSILFKK
ncbi:MAG: beta-lactamase family protein [Clostridium sp.]|nr:beta-lactamase family protein [Clostridium sp.]